jgi:molybdopterin/thiamine biosynthesis adenylyltransferase
LKVTARIPSVTEVEVEVAPRTTVARLKRRLCSILGLEEELTKLLLDGKPLKEEWPVSKLKLESKKLEIDYFWSRQMIIWGMEGQAKLREARVLIAGAGAIGNEAAKNLAMLGISRFTIVDYDAVEISNLSRMLFFDSADSGRLKSEVLAKRLHHKFPHLEITAVQGRLESIPLKVFLESSIIASGLDNFASRVFLSSISRRYLIPLVDGGIAGYQCRVQSYVPPEDPCPICPITSSQYGRLVGLRNPCDAPVEEAKIPSLSTTISLVASIQAQEIAKILIGYDDFLKRGEWPTVTGRPIEGIWLGDLRYNRYSVLKLVKNPNCMVCGEHGESREIVRRIEIPLARLASSGERNKILRDLFPDSEEFLFFNLQQDSVKMDESSFKRNLKRGDYILVTLKRKGGGYFEVVAKLI